MPPKPPTGGYPALLFPTRRRPANTKEVPPCRRRGGTSCPPHARGGAWPWRSHSPAIGTSPHARGMGGRANENQVQPRVCGDPSMKGAPIRVCSLRSSPRGGASCVERLEYGRPVVGVTTPCHSYSGVGFSTAMIIGQRIGSYRSRANLYTTGVGTPAGPAGLFHSRKPP